MKKLAFIQQNDPIDPILVVSKDAIEYTPIAYTYDQYGQKAGHENAGDYLVLNTQESADKASEISEKTYNVGDFVTAYDDEALFDKLINTPGVTLEQETVLCINYHDGHNFRTFFLDGEAPDGEVIDDPERIAQLKRAIENKRFVSDSRGIKKYETRKFEIFESAWAGDFELYSITPK